MWKPTKSLYNKTSVYERSERAFAAVPKAIA